MGTAVVKSRSEVPQGMARVDVSISFLQKADPELRRRLEQDVEAMFARDTQIVYLLADYDADRIEFYISDHDSAFEFKLRYS